MVPGVINMYQAVLDAINNKSVLERDGIWTLCPRRYVLNLLLSFSGFVLNFFLKSVDICLT